MNKNLLISIPEVPEEVVVPVFDDQGERLEWLVYEHTNLRNLLTGFVHHKIRTKKLLDFFKQLQASTVNELKYVQKELIDPDLFSTFKSTMQTLDAELMELCESIRTYQTQ
jgi:hypothetical protein